MTSSPQDVLTSEIDRDRLHVDHRGLHAIPATAPETSVESERSHWWNRKRKTEPKEKPGGAKRRRRAALLAFLGFAIVLAAVESMAVRGQSDFGRYELGLSGLWIYTPAVALEAGAITFAGLALWAMLVRDRAMVAHAMTFVMVMLAAGASWTGARAAHRPDVGAAYLALASGVALIMWHLIMHRLRRDDLAEAGEIEDIPAKPRFGWARWALDPVETGQAMRLAILRGISGRAEALEALAIEKAAKKARKQSAALPVLNLTADVLQALAAKERLAVAFGALGAIDVPSALTLLQEKESPVDQSFAYKLAREMGVTSADKKDVKTPRRRAVKKPDTKKEIPA